MRMRALFIARGAVIALMLTAVASTAEAGTVLDDYLALPADLLPEALRDPAARSSGVVLKDTRNGYLEVEVSGSRHSVALFTRKTGPRLLAMSGYEDVCEPYLRFFTTSPNGTWREVTTEILAPLKLEELKAAVNKRHENLVPEGDGTVCSLGCSFTYQLPRHGTTILVKDAGPGHVDKAGTPMTVAELRWNRSAFELHPIR